MLNFVEIYPDENITGNIGYKQDNYKKKKNKK